MPASIGPKNWIRQNPEQWEATVRIEWCKIAPVIHEPVSRD